MEFVEYTTWFQKKNSSLSTGLQEHMQFCIIWIVHVSILPADASVTTGIASANKKYVIWLTTISSNDRFIVSWKVSNCNYNHQKKHAKNIM